MKKSSSAVSVIGGADGPTSIFFKKNAKLTLKQKIQRAKNNSKRNGWKIRMFYKNYREVY